MITLLKGATLGSLLLLAWNLLALRKGNTDDPMIRIYTCYREGDEAMCTSGCLPDTTVEQCRQCEARDVPAFLGSP
jgi:hypothetical protein